jgi:hypothetical protein
MEVTPNVFADSETLAVGWDEDLTAGTVDIR